MSKWKNAQASLPTGDGDFSLGLGLYSPKSRGSLNFTMTNPSTGNPAKQVYKDQETGEEIGSWADCGRAIEIGEEKVNFDRTELDKLKEVAFSNGFDVQKVVDEANIDRAKIDSKAHEIVPQDEEQKQKFSVLHHGLHSLDKAIKFKLNVQGSGNLYLMWAEKRDGDRKLWASQMIYPQDFSPSDNQIPELADGLKDKSQALIQKVEEAHEGNDIVDNQRQKLEEAIEKRLRGEELCVEAEKETQEEQELEEELEGVL